MHWLFLLVNHNAIPNFCLNYDLQGASLEVVTEALWAKTEAETEAFKPETETEANNKKMCIFKLFKTWKLFEMYNLTWNGIIC